jgi:hypothetical protein
MLGGGVICLLATIGIGGYLARHHGVGLSQLKGRLELSRA